jgi:hypothetical protein
MQPLIEGVDFYIEDDKLVLTAKYLSERGYCCGNGCRHCPFNYINVPQPAPQELNIQAGPAEN